jgi:hypothetical protein
MNKFTLTIILVFLMFSVCLADKPTSYTSVEDVKVVMNFNVPKNVQGVLYYIPIQLKITGTAKTADEGERTVTVEEERGPLSESKMTPDSLFELLEADFLKNAYAEFYLEALDQVVPNQ